MFMNTAIDQNLDKFKADNGREPTETKPPRSSEWVLANVRGTVQADILKRRPGPEHLHLQHRVQPEGDGRHCQYFVHHNVRNFYSVHQRLPHREAGANPISQLAFTLSNGFTFVEAYLARGHAHRRLCAQPELLLQQRHGPRVHRDGPRRPPHLGHGHERKIRRQRAQPEAEVPHPDQGRSLHAQEIQFNDIRTTLQALIAIYDNCNSLHTNAFDEAITTPTEDSVRRAMAIQLIINREWGLAKNENPSQGAFIIEELTELVEEAVLTEFERIAERGGVLGAMETGFQRGKIQDESMHYEMLKHTGELPIIGVNTFRNPKGDTMPETIELARSTEEEKQSQLSRLQDFHTRHAAEAPVQLKRPQQAVIHNTNVFDVLMDAVRVCSLGQITRHCSRWAAVPAEYVMRRVMQTTGAEVAATVGSAPDDTSPHPKALRPHASGLFFMGIAPWKGINAESGRNAVAPPPNRL